MKKIIIMVSALLLVAGATLTLVLVLKPKNGDRTVTINYHSEEAVVSLYKEKVTNSEEFVVQVVNDTHEYEFIGWFFDEARTEEFNMTKFKEQFEKQSEIDLYAKWVKFVRYQVSFIVDGEVYLVKDAVRNQKVDTHFDNPEKEGYDFVGWYLGEELFDFDSLITKDISIHAVFKEVEYVTITFNLDGGYGIQLELQAIKGRPFSLNEEPVKDGYNFMGFTLNGSPFDLNSNIEGDINLVAQWEIKMLTITLIVEGESSEVVVPYGTSVYDLVEPTKEDYLFNGWLDNKNNLYTGLLTSNITLTASFIEDNVYYMVTFITDGGTPVENMYILSGSIISEPVVTTKERFTFLGWFFSNGDEFVINMNVITKDTVLYAHWEQDPQITITFDFGHPMFPNYDQVIYAGDTLVGLLPEADDGEQYILNWYYKGNIYVDEPLYESYILIAGWALHNQPQYTVTLLLDPVVELTFYEGELFVYDIPEMEGHEFAYWKLGNDIFDEYTPITADITLKPYWFTNFYNVKYIYNGQVVFEGAYSYDFSYANFPHIVYAGELLEKLYIDQALTIPIDPSEKLKSDMIFYVRPLKLLTLTFYYDENVIEVISDHLEGTPLLYDEIPTFRDGDYALDYWVDGDEYFMLTENTIINKDMDYYAVTKYEPIQTQYLAYIYIFGDNEMVLHMEEVMIDIGTIVTTSLIQDLYDSFENPTLEDYIIFEVLLNNETPPPFEIFELAAIRVNVVPK